MWKAVVATVFVVIAAVSVSGEQHEGVVLKEPQNLTMVDVSSTGAVLSWDLSNSSKVNLNDVIFRIVVEQDGNVVMTNESRQSEEPLYFNLTSLEPNTQYTVKVHAESIGFQESGVAKTSFTTLKDGLSHVDQLDTPRMLFTNFVSCQVNWTLVQEEVSEDYIETELCNPDCTTQRVSASSNRHVIKIYPERTFTMNVTAVYERSDVPQNPITIVRRQGEVSLKIYEQPESQPILHMRTFADHETFIIGANVSDGKANVTLRIGAHFCFEGGRSNSRRCPRDSKLVADPEAPPSVRYVGLYRNQSGCFELESDAPRHTQGPFVGYGVLLKDGLGKQIENGSVTTERSSFCDGIVADFQVQDNTGPAAERSDLDKLIDNLPLLGVIGICIAAFVLVIWCIVKIFEGESSVSEMRLELCQRLRLENRQPVRLKRNTGSELSSCTSFNRYNNRIQPLEMVPCGRSNPSLNKLRDQDSDAGGPGPSGLARGASPPRPPSSGGRDSPASASVSLDATMNLDLVSGNVRCHLPRSTRDKNRQPDAARPSSAGAGTSGVGRGVNTSKSWDFGKQNRVSVFGQKRDTSGLSGMQMRRAQTHRVALAVYHDREQEAAEQEASAGGTSASAGGTSASASVLDEDFSGPLNSGEQEDQETSDEDDTSEFDPLVKRK